MQGPGEALTEGGIIGHANGDPGLVTFRVNGHDVPLSVHFPTGAWTVIVCWKCADRPWTNGVRCTACRPAPPTPAAE